MFTQFWAPYGCFLGTEMKKILKISHKFR